MRVNTELSKFESDIINMSKYNYTSLKSKIDSYKFSTYYNKLQVKTEVDNRLAELLVKYNNRIVELGLNS